MNLRTLRVFVEVVRQGGFSQAAEVVSLTQSSVSKAVRTLEDELGTPLLNRIGHKSELTAAGEIAFRRALVLLAERNDLIAEINELRDLKGGTLRIGLPPVGCGVLFAQMFATYRSRYPRVNIELIEHGSKKLRECLEAGEVDLAALLIPIDETFAYQQVRNEPLVAVLPGAHSLSRRKRINFSDLADSPFILFEEGFALNALIMAACDRRAIVPRVTARSGQIDFIADLVAAGLGVAFLPRMLAQKHKHAGIALVPLDEPDTDWNIALAWRAGAHLPPAAIAWLELAKELR
ncbi:MULTISPECIES: LysR family transcriptional regulator [Pseudomonas]|jgi:DNA-binding transcriptional LysR family regulator|uniref:LysR family transcriptional regulator n=1 Tax=Pseudomonas juntendi TaxID=2666183 RepID=A0ABD4YI34_9PSED|nr:MULTISPECIES: LysR family transcriptional regulator [Pseudomonas]MDH0759182.1 LysR family transcriptional regulator [Pseudomonas juntendi]MDH1575438.1 LysR family transcriptional regulator [Pseudomonas sp. GD03746]MDH1919930.1 LysR family transcriptional regulator [Pseudomonas juntendi]NMY76779.1 LysR family transcriptional regulator [Pseudomonas sp. WS 5071]NNA04978.1 LysR family transcriptional regulator [Pseudomonas lundensis]